MDAIQIDNEIIFREKDPDRFNLVMKSLKAPSEFEVQLRQNTITSSIVPPNELWLIDSKGKIHKIVGIKTN